MRFETEKPALKLLKAKPNISLLHSMGRNFAFVTAGTQFLYWIVELVKFKLNIGVFRGVCDSVQSA